MKSLPLPNATRRLGAPRNWNHETDGLCHTLEILDRDGDMMSAWQPTDAERQRIAAGAPIWLFIQGTVHPVVGMSVGEVAEREAVTEQQAFDQWCPESNRKLMWTDQAQEAARAAFAAAGFRRGGGKLARSISPLRATNCS